MRPEKVQKGTGKIPVPFASNTLADDGSRSRYSCCCGLAGLTGRGAGTGGSGTGFPGPGFTGLGAGAGTG